MGAKKVFFVDKSQGAVEICQENYEMINKEYEIGETVFVVGNIRIFDSDVDTVLENPPFGTKEKHVDKLFLEAVTKVFVEAICRDYGFEITDKYEYDFPIKAVFKFHEKPVKSVDVGLWRMQKKTL